LKRVLFCEKENTLLGAFINQILFHAYALKINNKFVDGMVLRSSQLIFWISVKAKKLCLIGILFRMQSLVGGDLRNVTGWQWKKKRKHWMILKNIFID